MKGVATQMRSMLGAQEMLLGYSLFLEGRVAYANGATSAAEVAFQEAVAAGFPLGQLGIRAASGLLQMGYHQLAREALLPLEADFKNELAYWQAVFDVAYTAREDEALLLKAAKRAYDLAPNDTRWQFNYAAALLTGQWRPEEALRLTVSLLDRYPDSVGAQLNHILALILNGRAEDAAVRLDRIDYRRVSGPDVAVYHFVSAAVNRAREKWTVVREDLRALESEPLFPKERRWLEEIRRSLP